MSACATDEIAIVMKNRIVENLNIALFLVALLNGSAEPEKTLSLLVYPFQIKHLIDIFSNLKLKKQHY
jgi:hypothetical protein